MREPIPKPPEVPRLHRNIRVLAFGVEQLAFARIDHRQHEIRDVDGRAQIEGLLRVDDRRQQIRLVRPLELLSQAQQLRGLS